MCPGSLRSTTLQDQKQKNCSGCCWLRGSQCVFLGLGYRRQARFPSSTHSTYRQQIQHILITRTVHTRRPAGLVAMVRFAVF